MKSMFVFLLSLLLVSKIAPCEESQYIDDWDSRFYTGPGYQYVDEKCHSVSIRPVSSDAPRVAQFVEKTNGWTLYESDIVEENPGCYGYCKAIRSDHKITIFECRKDGCSDFPLIGAKYERIVDKGDLPSFKCTRGCTSIVPQVIHDTGSAEDDEDAVNIEYNNRLKTCRFK